MDQTPSVAPAANTYAGDSVAENSAGAEAEVDRIVAAAAAAVAGEVGSIVARMQQMPGAAGTAAEEERRGSRISRWVLWGVLVGGYWD